MPREIATTDGLEFRFRDYELPELGPTDVRVQVEFAAPKHGTEMSLFRGSVQSLKRWDPELRLFVPNEEPAAVTARERSVGNTVVGTVTAVGADVDRFRVGDRVFGYGAIRELHQMPEERWRLAEGLSDAAAVCADPAHVALVAVRDGNIRIGDGVAVYGLGAIGLLAVQVARAAGASFVTAVDPVERRRTYAQAHGADLALAPTDDVAIRIKRATGNQGVDVALETSGSAAALNEAIRSIRQCGTVVLVAWGPKNAAALHLDEEFHHNRPNLIGSQALWQNPDRSHPLWNEERARVAALDLFRRGLITAEGLVSPVVPFGEAPDALRDVLNHPEQGIKLGVGF